MWTVPRLWPGETCFIVAGGPSVLSQNVETLCGRRVICINTSYQLTPWADYLIFCDERWWSPAMGGHCEKVSSTFKGQVVAASPNELRGVPLRLKRKKPPGLASERDTVVVNFTSLTAAVNFAVHLIGEGGRIVLLGADCKLGHDGRCHHHAPHPWRQLPGNWEKQKADLATIVEPLKKLRIDLVNCSPGSALPFWPIMALADYLAAERVAA